MAKYQKPQNQYYLEDMPQTMAPQLPPLSSSSVSAVNNRFWQRLPSADLDDDTFPDIVYYESIDYCSIDGDVIINSNLNY